MIAILMIISATVNLSFGSEPLKINENEINWSQFSKSAEEIKKSDYKNGLSYVLSGSIALLGGIWGQSITDDSVEKGIYTVFQTIGIASIGYGAFMWQVGGDDRNIYETLLLTDELSQREKTLFLRSYYRQRAEKKKRLRLIKAITHGMVAGFNIYNASIQDKEGVKNGLYFIGGVNLLAAISFTFDF